MVPNPLPSQERLYELFEYRDGKLFRRSNGKQAGNYIDGWYARVSVDKVSYLLHRVVWKYHTGNDPKDQIDHINGEKQDNRIENLREADKSQNMCNKGPCGLLKRKGVYYNKRDRGYYVRVSKDGKMHYGGFFKQYGAACRSAEDLLRAVHGEFAWQ